MFFLTADCLAAFQLLASASHHFLITASFPFSHQSAPVTPATRSPSQCGDRNCGLHMPHPHSRRGSHRVECRSNHGHPPEGGMVARTRGALRLVVGLRLPLLACPLAIAIAMPPAPRARSSRHLDLVRTLLHPRRTPRHRCYHRDHRQASTTTTTSSFPTSSSTSPSSPSTPPSHCSLPPSPPSLPSIILILFLFLFLTRYSLRPGTAAHLRVVAAVVSAARHSGRLSTSASTRNTLIPRFPPAAPTNTLLPDHPARLHPPSLLLHLLAPHPPLHHHFLLVLTLSGHPSELHASSARVVSVTRLLHTLNPLFNHIAVLLPPMPSTSAAFPMQAILRSSPCPRTPARLPLLASKPSSSHDANTIPSVLLKQVASLGPPSSSPAPPAPSFFLAVVVARFRAWHHRGRLPRTE